MSVTEFTDHPLLKNVRKQVGEEVLQATMFQCVNADLARHTMSKVSPLAAMGVRFFGKKKAGGLPNMGILVLTPTTVRAYSCAGGGMSMRPKEEVAVWQRDALQVSIEKKGGADRLTLKSPSEGEDVTVEALKGYEAITDEILNALR